VLKVVPVEIGLADEGMCSASAARDRRADYGRDRAGAAVVDCRCRGSERGEWSYKPGLKRVS
jgi:hypothetical protein